MSVYKELSFENDVDEIQAISFSVMSPDEIRKKSVAEITSTDTYSNNEPIIGGLFDSRMGVIDNDKICKTCEQKNTFCPGHFGHIELAKPVYYIQFFDTIRKLLKCVCFRCSSLLIDPQSNMVQKLLHKKISKQKKFELIYKCCSKIKKCGQDNPNGCGAKQPNKIVKENIGKIYMEWKALIIEDNGDDVRKLEFSAEEVMLILKRINNEDLNVLGFNEKNKPEWMICTVFPVPPPSVRPSVRNDTGQRCEDDLTHKLCDIIKTNKTLGQKIERNANKEQIDYWTMLVQYHVSTFVDNQLPGVAQAKQRTGRPLRSLTERLKSKEGRIRGNLMGKRVDFSARSVITPDPNISIDELGVPIKIAMNLTFPEVVNSFNMESLKQAMKNGQDNYPGAKYLRKRSEGFRCIRLKIIENIDDILNNLEKGDIVDRHLLDGDYVLFNRQPSLHKMSMMAHKVRVMKYDTFRLNVCCTPSYNADYDGDEMNMHVPQSYQTENELIELASVPTQILSPRDSSPIISIVQDIALGVFKLTNDNTFVDQKQLFNLMANNSKFIGELPEAIKSSDKNKKSWTGKSVLSTIIPPLLNMRSGDTVIENGKITKGIVTKKTYQDMTNGLVHIILNDYGKEETKNIFDNTQKLICDWLVYNGFSVGISDLVITKDSKLKMKEALDTMKKDTIQVLNEVHKNTMDNTSIKSNNEFFEDEMSNKLDIANKNILNIVSKSVDYDDNRMMNMIKSKSKGNLINISQMMGCVGQQSIEGKRIIYGFDNRTLPHYTKYDDTPESRGFVSNSFISGLNPQEFFFHAMGGREGLIDTAVKTSETGYIQRKLVKAMEDCKVNFDNTVRNASGSIVQFLYGDDGMNSVKLEKQKIVYMLEDNILTINLEEYDNESCLKIGVNKSLLKQYCKTLVTIKKDIKSQIVGHDASEFLPEKVTNKDKDKNVEYFEIKSKHVDTLKNIQNFLETRYKMNGIEKMRKEYLLTDMDNLKYLLNDDTIKEYNNDATKTTKITNHFEKLLNDRKFMITKIFNNKVEDTIIYPISFERLIINVEKIFNLKSNKLLSNLNPLYVLDKLKDFEEKSKNIIRHENGVKILHMLMRCYMSPKRLLYKYRYTTEAFDYLLDKVHHEFLSSIVQASEMVGVVAAQSIGEPTTQLTLNTFHLSGVASASKAVRGVPRIKELLSISKNIKTPSSKIYLRPELSNDKSKTKDVINAIETKYLKDAVKITEIYFEPNDETQVGKDQNIINLYKEYQKLDPEECIYDFHQWLLRIEIDKEYLINNGITTHDIHFTLKNAYENKIQCVFSDDNADDIIFRISLTDDSEDMITELKAIEYDILENLIIKGVDKIKKIMCAKLSKYKFNDEKLILEKDEENVLFTDGSNLKQILKLDKYVDSERTISNDIIEIYEIFGIEAARTALFNEIDDILNDSTSVNQRHISLLVDTMTSKGTLLSIDRHGINRSDIGPLAKCSFEETSDVIIKAGVFNECDKMSGVAANIMLGQIPKCGTGDAKILIDESKFAKSINDVIEEYDEIEDMNDEECDFENINIDYQLPSSYSKSELNIIKNTLS